MTWLKFEINGLFFQLVWQTNLKDNIIKNNKNKQTKTQVPTHISNKFQLNWETWIQSFSFPINSRKAIREWNYPENTRSQRKKKKGWWGGNLFCLEKTALSLWFVSLFFTNCFFFFLSNSNSTAILFLSFMHYLSESLFIYLFVKSHAQYHSSKLSVCLKNVIWI